MVPNRGRPLRVIRFARPPIVQTPPPPPPASPYRESYQEVELPEIKSYVLSQPSK
jgi:hypothetical protein